MRIIYLTFVLFSFFSCADKKLVDKTELNGFLQSTKIVARKDAIRNEIKFWSTKVGADNGNVVYTSELARNYLSYFHLTGDIRSLHAADSLMNLAATVLNYTDPKMLQALSQLSITRHMFKQAFEWNEQAKKRSASPFAYTLIRFDAEMELGRYAEAEKALKSVKDQSSFHLLIRRAKQKDHEGDLEGAIALMESAFGKVKGSDNDALYCWALSNLGDMYGHAGRVKESYRAYTSVLQKDPGYLFALKGIAWIAYAHDNDPALATSIIRFIMQHNASPDYLLTLAEFAEAEGKMAEKSKLEKEFVQTVSRPEYGDMYNKYLIELLSDDPKTVDQALALAEKEVESRPTPETFSWLAWTKYRRGDVNEAAALFQNHVAFNTHEPEPLLKGYYILAHAGRQKEAVQLKELCLDAAFELGPVAIKNLNKWDN